jgi:hypothetical protein
MATMTTSTAGLTRGCVAAWILAVASTPCMAQGSRTSLTAARPYIPADVVAGYVSVPPNLRLDGEYRPLVESMLEHSPTFRRQCLRVAGDARLTIRLYPFLSSSTRGARAMTRMARGEDGLSADIYITRNDDEVELIAHEMEHIIEQLDEVDLFSMARLPHSGVHHVISAGATFETSRAAETGLRVAREVREWPRGD